MKSMNNRKENLRKIAKKGLTLGLCAVLAAGAFEGVSALTGWQQSEVEAAVKRDGQVTLVKGEAGIENKGPLDVSDIVEAAMPSVVTIATKSIQEMQEFYGFFGYDGYSYEQEVEGSGSGIIIGKNEENLLLATNYHVVQGATTVSVSFIDGEIYEAEVRGFDEDKDLAVVSVSMENLKDETLEEIKIATIGSSDSLRVGEQVVAIGNALGYGQSVTTGIVSAKNRRLDGNGVSEKDLEDDSLNLIQTDAAINPGNSGGALLNMDGELVGINSAKMASTDVEGMGYAIAISDVADILENLMNETPRNKIEEGPHGIIGIQGTTVSQEGIQIYGIPEGVFVAEITEDGPAEKAGIKKNMVITHFDGKRVRTIDSLVELLEYYEPGEEVEVVVEMMDGDGYQDKTVVVVLGESAVEEKEEPKEEPREEEKPEEEEESEKDSQNPFEQWEEGQEMPSIEDFFRQW